MSVRGIDLSGNNGTGLDFERIRRDGRKFVFFKVNEGDWHDKSTTHDRVAAAKKAGLLVGGYNFVRPRPGRSGAAEFDIFYHYAKQAGLLNTADRKTLRPVIDIEATAFTGPLAGYRTRAYVKSWIRQCIKRVGVKPIIYTGQWFWDGQMKGNADTTRGCPLWLAAYTSESNYKRFKPKGFDHISFWQYSDKGRVPGVKTRVDLNVYLGDYDALNHNYVLR